MAFCGNCGTHVQDGVKFCPSCGKAVGGTPSVGAVPAQQQYQQQATSSQSDAQENKTMAIIAYILFFVPLLTGAHKTSPFVKYHVNQGTLVFGIGVVYAIISAILRAVIKTEVYVFGWPTYTTPVWLSTILWILSLGILALVIYGIYNAATGKTKPLPLIGDKITIFK